MPSALTMCNRLGAVRQQLLGTLHCRNKVLRRRVLFRMPTRVLPGPAMVVQYTSQYQPLWGWQQASEAAKGLAELGVQHVVVSPFLRCLQTAREVMSVLPAQPQTLSVDSSVCEVLNAQTLTGGDRDLPSGPMASWFWGTEAVPSELVKASLGKAFSVQVQAHSTGAQQFQPVVRRTRLACLSWVPTTARDARGRSYALRSCTGGVTTSTRQTGSHWLRLTSKPGPGNSRLMQLCCCALSTGVQAAADAHAGCVLVITHGEAVRRSVTRLVPWAMVYEVQHAGYIVSTRQQDEDGDWEPWQIDRAQAVGVSWMQ